MGVEQRNETEFRVAVDGGVLVGARGGDGLPALVLHGGPAIPDYTEGLADELSGLLSATRYTQRGVAPSEASGPYTIEAHCEDAIAVLDSLGIDRVWLVGHSWGAHLALHLAIARPQRLHGVVAIGALGAFPDGLGEMGETMDRRLTAEQRARVAEVEWLRREGRATEDDLRERWEVVWPLYFADPARALPTPPRAGADCSREANASIVEHFDRGTLLRGLPGVRLPMLFVHGVLDPLPPWSAERTAALVPGAALALIPECGHFPWAERPGEVRRIVGEFLAELE
jgi:pimeloyl-ACP methyl ester carboxylesterase